MAWENELFDLFDDLEAQASRLFAADRDLELVDRSRAEYAAVSLASRLMASLDTHLRLEVKVIGSIEGEVGRVGDGWILLHGPSADWLIPWTAIVSVLGAATRSVSELAWSPLAKLGIGSAMRRLAETEQRCVVHLATGSTYDGHLGRVGQDFVELRDASGQIRLISLRGVVAAQSWE
jgi:hypothetical protein